VARNGLFRKIGTIQTIAPRLLAVVEMAELMLAAPLMVVVAVAVVDTR
jgi:hypothetical protein